jgi:hypothetical protein
LKKEFYSLLFKTELEIFPIWFIGNEGLTSNMGRSI